jgi:hypothetical protein
MDAKALRSKADRFRQLAREIADEQAAQALNEAADEYETLANGMETGGVESGAEGGKPSEPSI